MSEEGTRLICLADRDAGAADEVPSGKAPTATGVVKGTVFPLDPARVYTVQMWSPPTEPAFVELLARATICWRSPGCSVVMAPSPWLRTVSAGQAAR